VYRLKRDNPDRFVGLNGGVQTLDEVQHHLRRVDGVMLGRAAYHNPGMLADVDSRIFGEPARPVDHAAIMKAMADHAARHIASGGRLSHVTRHMVGLFHGQPGARRFRQILSTEATRPGAGPEVLRTAYDEIGDAAAERAA
jgi:tRNA-dihydrouridine synthase A